jgi:hypothetical protein
MEVFYVVYFGIRAGNVRPLEVANHSWASEAMAQEYADQVDPVYSPVVVSSRARVHAPIVAYTNTYSDEEGTVED